MKRKRTLNRLRKGALVALFLLIALVVAMQFPAVYTRVNWRVDTALTYLRGMLNPIAAMPTPVGSTPLAMASTPTPLATATVTPTPSATPPPSPTPLLSPTPTLTPTAIPGEVKLAPPIFEAQEINNCGPATLAHYLRFYGWKGGQSDIAKIVKPYAPDRNVNVDELVVYARNYTGWLKTEFRVNGNLDILRRLIAAGLPVMIEGGFISVESYWPGDDRWAGHYLLLTAYNDATKIFTTQDSFQGPNLPVSYADLDKKWQAFNRVYIVVYPPDSEQTVRDILGADWDVTYNRTRALEKAKQETQDTPQNTYAWFNLGGNLVYFDRYAEAVAAFDQARKLGLPQRMLRYQFTPFMAYFYSNRIDDLMALADYALQITNNSEEALLWRGWGLYRQGKRPEAIESFNKALKEHPGYTDAEYGLKFVQNN